MSHPQGQAWPPYQAAFCSAWGPTSGNTAPADVHKDLLSLKCLLLWQMLGFSAKIVYMMCRHLMLQSLYSKCRLMRGTLV